MRLLKAMREAERFSPTEQSVIDYMLKNPTEIASLSIRELAEKTYSSPAGIFRPSSRIFNIMARARFPPEESPPITMFSGR